jgi:putative transcriptional regulator
MADPNFNETAVLVCQHGQPGTYGLVLNRPSHMPLAEVFDNPPSSIGDLGRPQRIYMGGPVQPEELQVLQVSDKPAPGSFPVATSVNLGGYWGGLKEILEQNPETIRLFLGYSGWAAGQLAQEVEMGAWEVWNVDLKKLLLGSRESWQGGLGPIRSYLASL